MNCVLSSVYQGSELEEKTRNIFNAFICDKTSLDEIFSKQFGVSYKLIFGKNNSKSVLYNLLGQYYKNEYFIKRAFTKLLLLKPNLIVFTELPINDCRADIVSVNGKSITYEIKTKYDSFIRASKQLNTYSYVFEYVYIICPNEKANEAKKIIPDYCGIYSYDDKRVTNRFRCIKKATISPNLDSKRQLDVFIKNDTKKIFGTTDHDLILKKYNSRKINFIFKKYIKDRFSSKSVNFKEECNLL